MPHHDTQTEKAARSDSNLLILCAVGIFLILSVLLLWYFQQRNHSTNSTTSTSATTTYKSPTSGYSVAYPSSWGKDETSGNNTDGSTYKIVLLNRKDSENPSNGQPNLMIYEKFTGDLCTSNDTTCKTEKITLNGKSVTKITNSETNSVIYNLDGGLLVFAFPNGDQAAIDKVMESFTY